MPTKLKTPPLPPPEPVEVAPPPEPRSPAPEAVGRVSRTPGAQAAAAGWDAIAELEHQPGQFWPTAFEVRCLSCVGKTSTVRVVAGPLGALPAELPIHTCPAGKPLPKVVTAPQDAAPTWGTPAERTRLEFAIRAGDAAVQQLLARARAPQEAEQRLGEKLRAAQAPVLEQAKRVAAALEPYRTVAESWLKAITHLRTDQRQAAFIRWQQSFGPDSIVFRDLYASADRLRGCYQVISGGPYPDQASIGSLLAGIPGRIERLTFKDVHTPAGTACPAVTGRECGCATGKLRGDVERAERAVSRIPQELLIISEKFQRVHEILTARGDPSPTAEIREDLGDGEPTTTHPATDLVPPPKEED